MKRLSAVIWMVVIVASAFVLYTVKYQVQTLKNQIAESTRELEQEKEALRVVAAEWAYLNRPERLQQLAAKYLSSAGVTADQVAEIEAIRFPTVSMAKAETQSAIKPVSMKVDKAEQ